MTEFQLYSFLVIIKSRLVIVICPIMVYLYVNQVLSNWIATEKKVLPVYMRYLTNFCPSQFVIHIYSRGVFVSLHVSFYLLDLLISYFSIHKPDFKLTIILLLKKSALFSTERRYQDLETSVLVAKVAVRTLLAKNMENTGKHFLKKLKNSEFLLVATPLLWTWLKPAYHCVIFVGNITLTQLEIAVMMLGYILTKHA